MGAGVAGILGPGKAAWILHSCAAETAVKAFTF